MLNTLVIDKAKWVNGGNNDYGKAEEPGYDFKGGSMMRNEKGNMCCLGFQASQCGVNLGRGENGDPMELAYFHEDVYDERFVIKDTDEDSGYYYLNTQLSQDCIKINDDRTITYKQRVDRLRRRLKREGITLKIIDSSKGKK